MSEFDLNKCAKVILTWFVNLKIYKKEWNGLKIDPAGIVQEKRKFLEYFAKYEGETVEQVWGVQNSHFNATVLF